MHAFRLCAFAIGLASLTVACGGGSPQAQNAQAKADLRNEIADILEKVTDRPSAQRAIEQVKGVVPRWKQVAEEGKALGEAGAFDSKLDMRIRASERRLAEAKLKLSAFPGELDDLRTVLGAAEIK